MAIKKTLKLYITEINQITKEDYFTNYQLKKEIVHIQKHHDAKYSNAKFGIQDTL